MPARIGWGVADRFQKLVECGERLPRDLRAPLTPVGSARHFVPQDNPELVADAINQVVATAGAR